MIIKKLWSIQSEVMQKCLFARGRCVQNSPRSSQRLKTIHEITILTSAKHLYAIQHHWFLRRFYDWSTMQTWQPVATTRYSRFPRQPLFVKMWRQTRSYGRYNQKLCFLYSSSSMLLRKTLTSGCYIGPQQLCIWVTSAKYLYTTHYHWFNDVQFYDVKRRLIDYAGAITGCDSA